jgi:hypothetical protein
MGSDHAPIDIQLKNNIDLSPCQSNGDWGIEICGLIMEFVVELSNVGTATKHRLEN